MTRTVDQQESLKSEPFFIREVTVDDAAELVKYLRGILSDPLASIAYLDEMVLDSLREREHLRKLEMSETGLGIIAVSSKYQDVYSLAGSKQDQIIGFLTLEPTKRRKIAHVVELGMSVREDWRGRGVGHGLVGYAVAWAMRNGKIEKIVLNVFSENEAAINLYKSAGFVVEGVLKNQIKIGDSYQDLVLMSKPI